MKNIFFTLVQKCICLDFLINAFMNLNYYKSLNFLTNIKNENLRNIKFLCYLYEYSFNDNLIIDNIDSFKISKCTEENFDELLQINLSILSDLNALKKLTPDTYALNLLNALTYSYFNFISSIQYFSPSSVSRSSIYNEDTSLKINSHNNIRLFNFIDDSTFEHPTQLDFDFIRQKTLESINIFFDFDYNTDNIIDEYYEVFFENNDKYKFHQYFIKTKNKIFKVRISNFTGKIFYLYQSLQYDIKSSAPINKDESKNLINKYLNEKFESEFDNFTLDKDYINTTTYNTITESYTFKYNYKDNVGKVDFNKGFYITINTLNLNIEEISLF
ncbi:hypothetical protein [Romboutsia lituseburensis]|uniref:hypothetical protein n=1 Tax=Romboutsia lituseburensis TaxID=1537 RepID=UPI00215A6E8E|nr:hypothetical protein [Romboutsia lituseburensis]MCR8746588.1 hypothetical protein [Romboutsia lituseburensis]